MLVSLMKLSKNGVRKQWIRTLSRRVSFLQSEERSPTFRDGSTLPRGASGSVISRGSSPWALREIEDPSFFYTIHGSRNSSIRFD